MSKLTSDEAEHLKIINNTPVVRFYEDSEDSKILFDIADKYTRHEFNIHGSGWIKIYYGMVTKGFEGNNFSDLNVTFQSVLKGLPVFFRKECKELLDLAGRLVEGYEPIDWHIECKSGYRYKADYFTNLKYGEIEGVDAKIAYDMSRCNHLVIIARAWKATHNEKYRREIMAQILDWIALNPYEYGIGWHANMNVALRLVSWLISFSFIREGFKLDCKNEVEFLKIFEKSVLDHRRFISANLEFGEASIHPNHYLGDLGGLLIGSMMTENWDIESKAWHRTALREFGLQFERHFGNDGVQYEAATNYHCFGLEMLTESLIFGAKIEGCKTPEEVLEWIRQNVGDKHLNKFHKMFMVLKDIIQPNGLIPIVSDNDSGRFTLFDMWEHNVHDWRFLCCIGSALFNDSSLLPVGTRKEHWTSAKIWFSIVPEFLPDAGNMKSAAYTDVGFYIMKTRDVYGFTFCGPIGTGGLGGHAHDDKLSMTLCLKGLEFFIDPGIFAYTASMKIRKITRSIYNHNTVCLSDEPQNRYMENSTWWGCHEDTNCRCLKWDVLSDRVIFKGQHEGYLRLPAQVTHQRTIDVNDKDKRIIILDDFISANKTVKLPSMVFTFMLHPECEVKVEKGNIVVLTRNGIKMRLSTSNGEWKVEKTCVSPRYGVKLDTNKLVIKLEEGVPENTIEIGW